MQSVLYEGHDKHCRCYIPNFPPDVYIYTYLLDSGKSWDAPQGVYSLHPQQRIFDH